MCQPSGDGDEDMLWSRVGASRNWRPGLTTLTRAWADIQSHISLSCLLHFPFHSASFSLNAISDFWLQLWSPAGAFLDHHNYNFSPEEHWCVWHNAKCKLSFYFMFFTFLCGWPAIVIVSTSSMCLSICLLTLSSLTSSHSYNYCPTSRCHSFSCAFFINARMHCSSPLKHDLFLHHKFWFALFLVGVYELYLVPVSCSLFRRVSSAINGLDNEGLSQEC